MATLTMDKDLLAAVRDGRIDLNTASDLHKARRELKSLARQIQRRELEVQKLKEVETAIFTRESEALATAKATA